MISATNIQTHQSENKRKTTCDISGANLPEKLYFDGVTNQTLKNPAYLCDWIAVALIYPAMLRGQPLHIDGPVSPVLLFNLNNDIQDLLLHFNPRLLKINVTAMAADMAQTKPGTDTGTGFSAGVDSFATLATYTGENVAPLYRLNSLSTFNVGAMGSVSMSAEIYQRYCTRVQSFATHSRMNWNTVDSNLANFFTEADANFVRTSTLRNIAAVLFFQDLHKCYLYSSSYPYDQTNRSHSEITYYEPILLPLLSTENVTFTLACAGLKRSEKISKVAEYAPARSVLDVCVSSASARKNSGRGNCSQCRKCARTMFNLDIIGRLQDFSEVFDLDYYHANRDSFIKQCLIGALKDKPLDSDVINLMGTSAYDAKLPLLTRMEIAAYKAKSTFPTLDKRRHSA